MTGEKRRKVLDVARDASAKSGHSFGTSEKWFRSKPMPEFAYPFKEDNSVCEASEDSVIGVVRYDLKGYESFAKNCAENPKCAGFSRIYGEIHENGKKMVRGTPHGYLIVYSSFSSAKRLPFPGYFEIDNHGYYHNTAVCYRRWTDNNRPVA